MLKVKINAFTSLHTEYKNIQIHITALTALFKYDLVEPFPFRSYVVFSGALFDF